jgi:hypothetical protein
VSIPTLEELQAAGEVLVTWGFWIIVYGAVTMLIGLIIIGIIAILNDKPATKFIK